MWKKVILGEKSFQKQKNFNHLMKYWTLIKEKSFPSIYKIKLVNYFGKNESFRDFFLYFSEV